MEYMDKKEAALKVAAMHHNFLDKATHEYMKLTGQVSEEFKQKLDDMRNVCLQPHNRSVTEKEITCEDVKAFDDCLMLCYTEEIIRDSGFRAAQKEMLDLLPGYRHPAEGSLKEYEIFFGDTRCELLDLQLPVWLNDDNLSKLPELYGEIRDYVRDAEQIKHFHNN